MTTQWYYDDNGRKVVSIPFSSLFATEPPATGKLRRRAFEMLFTVTSLAIPFGAVLAVGITAAFAENSQYGNRDREDCATSEGGTPDDGRIAYLMAEDSRDGRFMQQDYAKAISGFKCAAKLGYVDANYELGVMYLKGQGVWRDQLEAGKWFKIAASLSKSDMLDRICYAYYESSNYQQAIGWCKSAAERENSTNSFQGGAEFYLGVIYSSGVDVQKDMKEAIMWWKASAYKGDSAAQYNLGLAYEDGNGIYQDYAEAAGWFQQAAKNGHSAAMNNLGLLLANGQGVSRNYVNAYFWLLLGSTWHQEDKVMQTINKIEGMLDRNQIYENSGGCERLAKFPQHSSLDEYIASNVQAPRPFLVARPPNSESSSGATGAATAEPRRSSSI